MKKLILLIVLICALVSGHTVFSQDGIIIDYSGAIREPSAVLEVKSGTQGMLVPRVALTGTSSASPISSPATSLLVYNTASVSDVTPGYYYWNGSSWQRFITGVTSIVTGSGAATRLAFWSGTNTLSSDAELYWDNGNKSLGVGTSTPGAYKLNVQAGSGQVRIESSSDAPLEVKGTDNWAGVKWSDVNGTEYIWYHGGNSTFAIGGGGSNVSGKKLHVDGGVSVGANYDGNSIPTDGLAVEGSVGIGTSSPAGKLDIRPNNGTASVRFQSSGDSYPRIYMGGTDANVAFVINRLTPSATQYFGEDGDSGGFQFRGTGTTRIGSLGGGGTRIVQVDNSGNLSATSSLVGTGLGDNLGNHTATTTLNMNGNDIDFVRGDITNIHSLGGISFDWTAGTYDHESDHGIQSRDEAGNLSDDIRVNSFDNITNTIDANDNNGTSYFKIQHHSTGDGEDLFWVRSADGYTYHKGWTQIGSGTDRLNLELQGTFHRMAFNELRFYDWNAGGDNMTINNGSVGIGTTAPAYNLDVSGTGRFSSTLRADHRLEYHEWIRYIGGSNEGLYWENGTGAGWHIYPSSTSDMIMRSGDGNGGSLLLSNAGSTRGYIHWTADNQGWLNSARQWQLRTRNSDGLSPNLYFDEEGNESWTGNPGADEGKIEYHSNRFYIASGSNSTEVARFRRSGSDVSIIDNSGHLWLAPHGWLHDWITAPTGDNLGNHSATTTLSMNNHAIVGAGRFEPYGIGGNSGQGNHAYAIFQESGGWSSPYPDLRIAYHTGIKLGAHYSYNGIRFYNNHDMVTQTMSVGDGDNNVRIYYDLRVPFIYDLNNTGYYWNGDGSSRMHHNHTNESYTYGWFRNHNAGQGLYNQATGTHFYSNDANYWDVDSDRGFRLRCNGHNSTVRGYLYHDCGGNFGLLSGDGNWSLRVDNSNLEIYDNMHSNTSYQRFIYDRDNTGYYLNPDGYSQTHSIYANNWFRPQGSTGLYFQSYGGGWHMTDGTWIRQYNGKRVYLSAGLNVAGTIDSQYGASPRINSNHDNATGGGIRVSDDGGFYDFNDAWIEYRGSTGLSVRSDNTAWDMIFRMYTNGGAGAYDKRVATETNAYGLLGYTNNAWWYVSGYNFYNPSLREQKRDITPISGSLSEFVMEDLDKMSPSFYKYKVEDDEMQEGNEPKFRANMHLGLILDETPDYLQDGTFSGVDIYSLATLGVVAAKHNRNEIKEIKEAVGMTEETISIQDFGSKVLTENELWIEFSANFRSKLEDGQLPVVTVTANKPGVVISVVEKSSKGFKVHASEAGISFDYIAMANVVRPSAKQPKEKISSELMSGLRVDESEKQLMRDYLEQVKKDDEERTRNAGIEAIAIQDSMHKVMALPEDFVGPEENAEQQQKEQEEILRQGKDGLSKYIPVPADAPSKDGSLDDTNSSLDSAPKPGEMPVNAASSNDNSKTGNKDYWKTDQLVDPKYLEEMQKQEELKQQQDVKRDEEKRKEATKGHGHNHSHSSPQ